VYIDTRTGFLDPEKTAIRDGIVDWNDESNNTGVTFDVQETDNPPALPPTSPNSYIVVVNYDDHDSATAIGESQTFHGTNGVWNILTFHRNIRSGSTQEFRNQVIRSVSRHEGAHWLGLDHPTDGNCGPGQTIMLLFPNNETFINWCDNQAINADPLYGGTPTPTPCADMGESCSTLFPCCIGNCGEWHFVCMTCEPNPQDPHEDCMSEACGQCYQNGGVYCTGTGGNCWTPVVVDVLGNGFNLTNATDGVNFDDGNGTVLRTAWTSSGSDDAWLVLDRNGNGIIDNATELFGNSAPQPFPSPGELRHGFRALSEFDKSADGGNADGVISETDAIFHSLRLWQDTNHDGISSVSELHSLPSLGLVSIDLSYKISKYKDNNGNTFKYRAKVKDAQGAQLNRWVYDVFLDARRAP
jgi:hypothetical protein